MTPKKTRPQFDYTALGYSRVREDDDPDIDAGIAPDPIAKNHYQLKVHMDARGSLWELFRGSWHGGHVGQAYISTTLPGVVKGWHMHTVQRDRFVCIRGRVLVCTFDLMDPLAGVVETILDAERAPAMFEVLPYHAHGWKNIGQGESWIINLCSHEYSGVDEFRRGANDGPKIGVQYDWNRNRDG